MRRTLCVERGTAWDRHQRLLEAQHCEEERVAAAAAMCVFCLVDMPRMACASCCSVMFRDSPSPRRCLSAVATK